MKKKRSQWSVVSCQLVLSLFIAGCRNAANVPPGKPAIQQVDPAKRDAPQPASAASAARIPMIALVTVNTDARIRAVSNFVYTNCGPSFIPVNAAGLSLAQWQVIASGCGKFPPPRTNMTIWFYTPNGYDLVSNGQCHQAISNVVGWATNLDGPWTPWKFYPLSFETTTDSVPIADPAGRPMFYREGVVYTTNGF